MMLTGELQSKDTHHTMSVQALSCGAARYKKISKLTISKHGIFGISYIFNDVMLIQYTILQITKKNRLLRRWSNQ
ncbi:TPA: hypothetical protein HNO33_27405 [Escherichia coli]|nr:hypothetical protein AOY63_23310 [Escherichia coli]HAJ7243536.1 hypothetical protein [Escherichia coli]